LNTGRRWLEMPSNFPFFSFICLPIKEKRQRQTVDEWEYERKMNEDNMITSLNIQLILNEMWSSLRSLSCDRSFPS
jgi:hypothetical protein